MNSTRRLCYLIDIIVIALAYVGLDAAADAFPLRDFRILIVVSTLAKCVFLVFIWFWLLMRGDTVGTIGLKKPRNWLFSILTGMVVGAVLFIAVYLLERAGFWVAVPPAGTQSFLIHRSDASR
jgi:peptidoglycan biosynthesis protein MviN/MurJ (putative lipid II flippase)